MTDFLTLGFKIILWVEILKLLAKYKATNLIRPDGYKRAEGLQMLKPHKLALFGYTGSARGWILFAAVIMKVY